jgi:hypothetical protein
LNLEHGTLNMRVGDETDRMRTRVSMGLEIQSSANHKAGFILVSKGKGEKFRRVTQISQAWHHRYPAPAVSRLTHRDIAASKVEPHVKSAQKIEAEQSIHAACWGQCVAQSVKAAYPFSKRLNIFKG